jgi:glutamate dehydrogenase (NADP+)
LEGKICAVSGAGNVAQYTVEKLNQLGAKVVTLSDSGGTIYDPAGIDAEKLAWVIALKNVRRGRMSEYAQVFNAEYLVGKRPWGIPCACAFPSATQNEIDGADAQTLLANGCTLVCEGANMPCTPAAFALFQAAHTLLAPSKAANAGGVATSGLEMSQNALRMSWSREEVDAKLHGIMVNIHQTCFETAAAYGQAGNYTAGANIAGFVKVAEAMLAQGVI